MARDSAVQDATFDRLLAVLRTYTDPYHLQYPRLLAEGLTKGKIASKLEKDPDIVEFHLDRLYDSVPDLCKRADIRELLAGALKERDRLGPLEEPVTPAPKERTFPTSPSPEPKEVIIDFGPVLGTPVTEPAPEEPALIAPISEGPVRHIPSPEQVEVIMVTETVAEVPNTDLPPGVTLPIQERIVAYINDLTPGNRKILAILTKYEAMPPSAKVAAELERTVPSVEASISLLFQALHLGMPKNWPSGDASWPTHRFNAIKAAHGSDKVLPPRESRKGRKGYKNWDGPPVQTSSIEIESVAPAPEPEPEALVPVSAEAGPLPAPAVTPVDEIPEADEAGRETDLPACPAPATEHVIVHATHDGEILDVKHVPSLPDFLEEFRKLGRAGYRVEQSYSLVQLSGLVTVMVLVKRSDVASLREQG